MGGNGCAARILTVLDERIFSRKSFIDSGPQSMPSHPSGMPSAWVTCLISWSLQKKNMLKQEISVRCRKNGKCDIWEEWVEREKSLFLTFRLLPKCR